MQRHLPFLRLILAFPSPFSLGTASSGSRISMGNRLCAGNRTDMAQSSVLPASAHAPTNARQPPSTRGLAGTLFVNDHTWRPVETGPNWSFAVRLGCGFWLRPMQPDFQTL